MAKAARVVAALQRDGWILIRQRGSHRILEKHSVRRVFAYHDAVDLGTPGLAKISRDFGYSLAELRRMV